MGIKKPDIIPEVDAIKAGIDPDEDRYESMRNEDGRIRVTRSSEGEKRKTKAINNILEIEESKLNKLKEKLSSIKDSDDDEKSKKKKDKKKDKKKKKNPSYEETLLNAVPTDLSEYILDFRNGKKKKDKKKDDDDDEIHGLNIKGKDRKKNKDIKKDEKPKSEVAESFKIVEKLTKENIKEIDGTMKIADERINELMKASDRMRGKDTALSNFLQAKSTLINAKQTATRNLMDATVKVYDIEMKKEKSGASSAASDVELLAKVFPSIVSDPNIANAISKDISNSGKNKNSKNRKKNKKNKDKDRDIDDRLERKEREMLESGELEYNDYDAHIELEGSFTVAIKKAWTNGDWKFVGIDKKGKILDVPKKLLPKKSSVDLVFDDEKDIARDSYSGNVYRIIAVPTI